MSLRVLVDMNLSPEWAAYLGGSGYVAVHWSSVGSASSDDAVIMDWARAKGYVVFTNDMDFGTMLALTHERGPSVLQVRSHGVLPETIGQAVIAVLKQHLEALQAGAIVVLDDHRSRVRVLPL